jgi:hypothetical protein
MANGDPFTSFLNELEGELSDPSSNMYLPRLVLEQQPPYDPYMAAPWTFGSIQPPEGPVLAKSICGAIGVAQQPSQIWIATPANNSPAPKYPLPYLVLTNVQVVGLANVKLASLVADPPNSFNLKATINFGLLTGTAPDHNNNPYPLSPNIVVTGSFSLGQSCCQITPPNKTSCSGPSNDEVGTGTFTTTIKGSSGSALFEISFQSQAPELLVNVTDMQFTSGPISTTVVIDNIPNASVWDQQAQAAFNNSTTQALIVGQINQVLGGTSAQQTLSSVLQSSMNQYLQQQNLYPYGPLAF